MSDSALNALLRPAASSPVAAKPQNKPHSANGELRSDDSFSKALERRMNPAERSARGTEEAQRRDAATRPTEAQPVRTQRPGRQEQPVRRDAAAREKGDARPARTPSGVSERRDGKVAASDSPAKSEAASGAGAADAAAEPARTPNSAASSESPPAATAVPPAAAPVGTPATDPAAAASLAALLPNVAALPTDPAPGPADAIPPEAALFDGARSGTGASLLEKLIAEASGGTGSATAAETSVTAGSATEDGGTTIVDGGGATTTMHWKIGADATAAAGDPGAPTGLASATGATNVSTTAASALQPDSPLGLHAASFAPAGRVEQPPLPQLPVSTPAGQPAWAEDVGGRLVWMVGRHESKAEIVLTPPTLGKLEVSIHVGADQTTAHFVAATSAARDALEQAMPRLREVLQQAGIHLGQTNVSTSGEQQAQQHASGRHDGSRSASAGVGTIESAAAPSVTQWVRSGNGVVDTFA